MDISVFGLDQVRGIEDADLESRVHYYSAESAQKTRSTTIKQPKTQETPNKSKVSAIRV